MNQLDSLRRQKREIVATLRNKITEAIYPSRSIVNQIWEDYCKGLLPGVRLLMYDAKLNQYTRKDGTNRHISGIEFVSDIHPNQVALKELNDANLEILLCEYYQSNPIDTKIYSSTTCSFRMPTFEYKSYQVIKKAISFNEFNYPVEYLQWFIPLYKYSGGPLISFFDNENHPKTVMDIQIKLMNCNTETLKTLGFTKSQLKVLELYAKRKTAIEIAEVLSISRRTVDKHNQKILHRGKFLFPFNQFRTAEDVVHMLSLSGMFIQ